MRREPGAAKSPARIQWHHLADLLELTAKNPQSPARGGHQPRRETPRTPIS
ncbi:hypothetical protein [Streptomyces lutosisoli]|uniref:hypothetical protein n=1 Tax=Streptomyces lutosisoli TaxID=2665721 RepID=UPI0036D28B76